MPKGDTGAGEDNQVSDQLIQSLDEVTVINDILTLLFWAGEGISETQGAAVARGAMMQQERLNVLRAMLKPHTAQ